MSRIKLRNILCRLMIKTKQVSTFIYRLALSKILLLPNRQLIAA